MSRKNTSVITIALGAYVVFMGIKGGTGFMSKEATIIFGVLVIAFGIWKFIFLPDRSGKDKKQ